MSIEIQGEGGVVRKSPCPFMSSVQEVTVALVAPIFFLPALASKVTKPGENI